MGRTLMFMHVIVSLLYTSCVLAFFPIPHPPCYLEDAPGSLPDYSHCVRLPVCDLDAKYRTINGTCNNLQNPLWGSSFTPFGRLLPAVYSDGLGEPRKAKDGGDLPWPRRIRNEIFTDADRPSFEYTTASMEWGQLIAHDITSRIDRAAAAQTRCCTSDGKVPKTYPDVCYPLNVPTSDRYLSLFGVTCTPMIKAANATGILGCDLKPKQQISDATHYMDVSLTYGSRPENASALRSFKGGLLKVQQNFKGHEFPPNATEFSFCLNMTEEYNTCYLGGDPLRTNQQLNVAAMQVVLLREHNGLARKLAKLNPHWDDERLYQEARRINIAQFQHISYCEYLCHILDEFFMMKYKLCQPDGYRNDYDPSIHVNILNEFSTATFRVFHSNVPGDINFLPESRKCPYASYKLNEWAFNPSLLHDNLDGVVRSMVTQPQQEMDRFMTIELSETFARTNPYYGFDIISIDIMRGRDTGLAPYNALREICGLNRARTFKDLFPSISYKNTKLLQRLYNHPDDIDAFVGILLEEKFYGKVGLTAQCIIAEQFRRLKFGDRYFYEFANQAGSFTEDQLQAIREGSLFSSLLCRNTEIESIQWHGFEVLSPYNPLVNCKYLPKINLLPWKE